MQVVIVAGGRGTRLGALTRECPKALVAVQGRPFLHYQLAQLARQGFGDVLLCVGHLADQIVASVGDGTAWGLRVQYAHESPDELRGTAGALKRAVALLQDTFCVLNGDSYLPIDFRDPIRHFNRQRGEALMTVFRNAGQYGGSNAAVGDGWVTGYHRATPHERSELEWIDYGFRVFRKSVLALVASDGLTDLDDLYRALIAQRRLAAYPVAVPFQEIGSPEGLRRFKQFLKKALKAQGSRLEAEEERSGGGVEGSEQQANSPDPELRTLNMLEPHSSLQPPASSLERFS